MMQFSLLCLVLCIGTQSVAGADDSGYEHVREVDAWLRLHVEPTSWAEAGMRCFLEGGILASPTTSAMAQVMTDRMAQANLERVFTGINSIAHEDLRSIEGVPLADIPVGAVGDEVDNTGGNCLAFTGARKLTDSSCTASLPYFCRKEVVKKCGAKAKGYKYEPATGSCYKFHRAAKIWREALKSCQDEGAHLVIINSKNESLALHRLSDKNTSDRITGAFEPNYIFCGFRRWDDEEWVTVFGDTIEEAGFTEWTVGEPNNRGDNELCGSIFRDGLLNDNPCDKPYAYICEITP